MLHLCVPLVGRGAASFPGNAGLRLFTDLSARERLLVRCSGKAGLPPVLERHLSAVREFLSRLDKTFTIDQPPSWSAAARWELRLFSAGDVELLSGYRRRSPPADHWSEVLAGWNRSARTSLARQRLMDELCRAADASWFVVFDTLTIAPSAKKRFLESPNAVRDYCRELGRLVWRASPDRRVPVDHVFRYFGVPEYGRKDGRLHFHIVFLMKYLPGNCVDPNYRPNRSPVLREIFALKRWGYGLNVPIACRYPGDAFSRAGWRWPVDKFGVAIESKPVVALATYVSKYLNEVKPCLRTPWPTHFRLRMTRGFGLTTDLSTLSLTGLRELASLHSSVSRSARLIGLLARREMSFRLAGMPLGDFLDGLPEPIPLLERLRGLTLANLESRHANFGDILAPKLMTVDISDESLSFVENFDYRRNRLPLSGR